MCVVKYFSYSLGVWLCSLSVQKIMIPVINIRWKIVIFILCFSILYTIFFRLPFWIWARFSFLYRKCWARKNSTSSISNAFKLNRHGKEVSLVCHQFYFLLILGIRALCISFPIFIFSYFVCVDGKFPGCFMRLADYWGLQLRYYIFCIFQLHWWTFLEIIFFSSALISLWWRKLTLSVKIDRKMKSHEIQIKIQFTIISSFFFFFVISNEGFSDSVIIKVYSLLTLLVTTKKYK